MSAGVLTIIGILAVSIVAMARWWWLLWRHRCAHEHVRCVHGDEIVALGWRRRVCVDCGKPFAGPLPRVCWYTGRPHYDETKGSHHVI